jgi:Transposase domain (DUF772)
MLDDGTHLGALGGARRAQDRRDRSAARNVIDVHRCKTALVVMRVPERELLAAMRRAERVVNVEDLQFARRNRSTLHRLSFRCPIKLSQDGPSVCFGPIVFREHPADDVFVDIDAEGVRDWPGLPGRPLRDRAAFAKAVMGLPTTSMLIERLAVDKRLRRLCGWERPGQVPSESTFSRAFAEFATCELPSRVHEALIKRTHKDRLGRQLR